MIDGRALLAVGQVVRQKRDTAALLLGQFRSDSDSGSSLETTLLDLNLQPII